MSTEIINNLQFQLKIYQQMFEQMENSSNLEASISSSIITNNIVKPKVRYIKQKTV